MSRSAPRQLVFRGTWSAAGVLLGPPLTETERRRRALVYWEPGTVVYRLPSDGAYFVVWPAPRRLRAERAAGALVVARDGRWLAAPLISDEMTDAPPNTLLRPVGGMVQTEALGTPVDPSAWVDPGTCHRVPVATLGEPPPPPEVALAEVKIDLRAAAKLPPADRKTLEALAAAFDNRASSRLPPPPGPETPAWRRKLFEWGKRLSDWLRSPRDASEARDSPREDQASNLDAPAPPGRSAVGRWLDRITEWLTRAGLGLIVGSWHQRYLDRLLGMFESGDLQDALRHAIPLGTGAPSAGAALRPPSPRDRLEFGRAGQGPSRGIMGSEDAWSQLRRQYRAAVDKLVAARRLKEAAFVLAELLGEKHEAVAMLEREGEVRLAAELAETAQLGPELRVRLWAKAGDWARAVRLARRYNVFAAAVAGLKGGDQEVGDKLKALWATHRAEVGDYVGAIELVWPHRTPSQAWMNEAIALGGTAAARVLARQLALAPDSFPTVRARALALLDDDSPQGVAARGALADAFLAHPDAPGVRVLARALVRRLVADQPRVAAHRRRVVDLVKMTQDQVLRADMPKWVTDPTPSSARLTIEATDQGQVPIADAVRLATGRMLFALGEAGVLLTTADGRPLAHLKVPATHLVPSDTGHRALALVRRGQLSQVHRLDLVRWRATPWCEQPIDRFASTFDGWRWFVSLQSTSNVLMLDVTGRRPEIEWSTGASHPQLIGRSAQHLFVLGIHDELVIEVFDVERLRMLRRTPLRDTTKIYNAQRQLLAYSDFGGAGDVIAFVQAIQPFDPNAPVDGRWHAFRRPSLGSRVVAEPQARILAGAVWGSELAVAFAEEPAVFVQGLEWSADRRWLEVELRGATKGGLRRCGDHLVAFDDLGRTVVFGRESHAIEYCLRLRL